MIAPLFSLRRRRGLARIAVQPLLDDVMIELFAPQHPGHGLSLDRAMLCA